MTQLELQPNHDRRLNVSLVVRILRIQSPDARGGRGGTLARDDCATAALGAKLRKDLRLYSITHRNITQGHIIEVGLQTGQNHSRSSKS